LGLSNDDLAMVLDLAFHTTGGVIFDIRDDIPLATFQFTARNKTGKPASDDAAYVQHIGEQIYDNILRRAQEHDVTKIVYEYTDWHRNILGGKKSINKRREELHIEIRTQRTLGRTEGLLAMIGLLHGYEIIGFGANDVKKSFSAQSKTGVARMVAAVLPQFYQYTGDEKRPLRDIDTGRLLQHHISDALALALHASQYIRMQRALNR